MQKLGGEEWKGEGGVGKDKAGEGVVEGRKRIGEGEKERGNKI